VPRQEVAVGSVVAERYRVERLLGEGGMGTVWAAQHTTTRKFVALKFLKASVLDHPRVRQRFIREARAASAIRHPSVIQVHDVLELEDGSPVMVMELLYGETLAALLERSHAIRVPVLARIMLPVCSAVGKAHELGIVHRDLKPENIFLEKGPDPDEVPRVKVLDFGIAKLTALDGDAARSTDNNTGTGTILGTPFYMSPEQMFGEKDVDHRSDIWSLGIILYEALAGVRPTEADNVGQILKIVMTDAIVPLKDRVASVPEPLAALVGRMLTRDRELRPPDLHEVCDVLRAYTNQIVPSFGIPRSVVPVPDESSSPHHVLGRAPTEPEARRPDTSGPSLSDSGTEARAGAVSADLPGRRARRTRWHVPAALLGAMLVVGASVWRFAGQSAGGAPPPGAGVQVGARGRAPEETSAHAPTPPTSTPPSPTTAAVPALPDAGMPAPAPVPDARALGSAVPPRERPLPASPRSTAARPGSASRTAPSASAPPTRVDPGSYL